MTISTRASCSMGADEILQRSVDLDGERRLGETRADGGGQIGPGQRPLELAPAAVRKRNRNHGGGAS